MHNIQPNRDYRIVTMQLALPASLSEAEITDGLNNMLNDQLLKTEKDPFIVDWAFLRTTEKYGKNKGADFPIKTAPFLPEEGDLFR